jgi:hypothetical protein
MFPVMFSKKNPFSSSTKQPRALFSPRAALMRWFGHRVLAATMDHVRHQLRQVACLHDEYATGTCVQPLTLSRFQCNGVCGDGRPPLSLNHRTLSPALE